MNSKKTVKEKLLYSLDLWMSKGTASMLFLLFVITGIIILILGAVIWFLTRRSGTTLVHALWDVLMHTLDPGVVSGDSGTAAFLTIMVLATFAGVFFLALLIGFINDGIQAKMEDLSMGREPVIESNHTVILGFNESTFTIIEELIIANENNRKARNAIVVMDLYDKKEMEEKIMLRFPSTGNVKVVCRSGSIYDVNDLARCSISTAKSIIIADESDFNVIKSILACAQRLNAVDVKSDGYITAIINKKSNERAARIAGYDVINGIKTDDNDKDRLELLMLEDVVARIMAHTCRQSGLSNVFIELLNFSGSELYIIEESEDKKLFDNIKGKTIREINRHMPHAVAIGVIDTEGNAIIDDPNVVKVKKGYKLIILEEDDNKVRYEKKTRVHYEKSDELYQESPVRVLIMECNTKLHLVLNEMSHYLCEGSQIFIAADDKSVNKVVPMDQIRELTEKGISVTVHNKFEVSDCDKVASLIDHFKPNFILDLSDYNMSDEDADERTLQVLLYIHDYQKNHPEVKVGVTCEMRTMSNQNLVRDTVSSDFIISRNIASLMMAQISENRELKAVIESLLSYEGFEVYMKSPKYYFNTDKPIDLYSMGDAVAEKGEILIGYSKCGAIKDTIYVNPSKDNEGKTKKIRLSDDDHLIVIAEDYSIR